MKNILITTLFIILIASSAWSFDGNRKGFVLGGGLGFAPTAKWELDNASSINGSASGVGVNLLIGYAWNEKNMLIYEGNAVGYKPDNSSVDLFQGFFGASWYHYFNDTSKSMFTVIGIGTYTFEADGFSTNDRGVGFMLGGGVEISRHWQIGAYLSTGKTSDIVFDYKHTTFNILFTGVAF